ncbi:MAG: hypothetical protein NC095_04790 [Muribaculum sp.]|nr:hypothetical protein [Muribaculum sp.]
MKTFVKSILVVLVAVLAGCAKEESPENETLESVSLSFVHEAIANASEKNFEKENLPAWLTEYIHGLRPDNFRNVAAFQTKWKGEIVYYVYDDYFSCLLCTTFKSDGEKFDGSDNDFYAFWNSPRDWDIVYLSKSKIHDL